MRGSRARGLRTALVVTHLTLGAALPPAVAAHGPRPGHGDKEVIEGASLVASGPHVEVFADGVKVDAAFLEVAEAAYKKLERLTDRKLDTERLGPKILIYVSDHVTISHVWRGYEHPKDPKGIVFLSPRAYAGGLNGTNATYAHEMAHLFTWRYHSHTLREGLADYLALRIHPGAGVGPNADAVDESMRIAPSIAGYLGTTKPAPGWLGSDVRNRRAYYLASYRFVKYLIEKVGWETFMKLYDSETPEVEIARLYGASREQLVRMAGM